MGEEHNGAIHHDLEARTKREKVLNIVGTVVLSGSLIFSYNFLNNLNNARRAYDGYQSQIKQNLAPSAIYFPTNTEGASTSNALTPVNRDVNGDGTFESLIRNPVTGELDRLIEYHKGEIPEFRIRRFEVISGEIRYLD